MGRPSRWAEVKWRTEQAAIPLESNVAGVQLYPAPGAELVEQAGGLYLDAGSTFPDVEAVKHETGGVLEGFVKLAEGSPDDVLRFARRFGMLEVCECGLPHQHNPPRVYQGTTTTISFTVADQLVRNGQSMANVVPLLDLSCKPLWRSGDPEPVMAWTTWAERARAVLALASRLHRGKPGLPDDWRVAYPGWPWNDAGTEAWRTAVSGRGIGVERSMLGRVLNEWLALTGAAVSVEWHVSDRRPTIGLAADGLFPNLARELVFAVTKLDSLYVCSGCGELYRPSRRPRSEHHYCEECRSGGVAQRDYMRRYRAQTGA